MGKRGDGMQRLQGLDALAELHQAMGGEQAVPADEPVDGPPAVLPALLHVSRDRKSRKGKVVTLVEGFDADLHADIGEAVARSLKALCGVGGGWKEGVILLQGDHRDRAAAWLTEHGYRTKHKGG